MYWVLFGYQDYIIDILIMCRGLTVSGLEIPRFLLCMNAKNGSKL
jgi:hypothetical protein